MQTVIKKILSDRKRFLSLLLLADEQETMIDKYIGRGDMFVMYNQDGGIPAERLWQRND